eukprot:scaffold241919_cov23-Tisochrysis_lutea.AAC.1
MSHVLPSAHHFPTSALWLSLLFCPALIQKLVQLSHVCLTQCLTSLAHLLQCGSALFCLALSAKHMALSSIAFTC